VGVAARLPTDTRLDDRQLVDAERIANLVLPPLPVVPEDHFLKCMRTLTLLPARQEDDLTGELRLALYRKHFGRYPAEAWSFLVEKATLECRFFPTPSECKAILDRWNRNDPYARATRHAAVLATRERQARFDDVMLRLRRGEVEQAEVDQMPERWKRIAATQGHLWEGTYQLRPVRRGGEEQEGQRPGDVDDQHTTGPERAGRPHERTAQ
jgi:hypothetical protein